MATKQKQEILALKGGLLVHADAIKVLVKIEARGDQIELVNGLLMITPAKKNTKA